MGIGVSSFASLVSRFSSPRSRSGNSGRISEPATTITLVFAADGESISMFSGDQHLRTLKARFMAAGVDKLVNAKLACSY
jgi:hypothetical protein